MPDCLSPFLLQGAIHNTSDSIFKAVLSEFDPDVTKMIDQWQTQRGVRDLQDICRTLNLPELKNYFLDIMGMEVRLPYFHLGDDSHNILP